MVCASNCIKVNVSFDHCDQVVNRLSYRNPKQDDVWTIGIPIHTRKSLFCNFYCDQHRRTGNFVIGGGGGWWCRGFLPEYFLPSPASQNSLSGEGRGGGGVGHVSWASRKKKKSFMILVSRCDHTFLLTNTADKQQQKNSCCPKIATSSCPNISWVFPNIGTWKISGGCRSQPPSAAP